MLETAPGWHETSGPLPVLRARTGLAFDAAIPPWAIAPTRVRTSTGWTYTALAAALDEAAVRELAALAAAGFAIDVAPDLDDPGELLVVRIHERPIADAPIALDLGLVDDAPVALHRGDTPAPDPTRHPPCPDVATYQAHVAHHRQLADGRWTCAACEAER